MYSEDELLPISALQHMAFCERQAALIHIENLWEENVLTTEGHIMHEHAHSEEVETRGQIRISRGLRLRSLELGLVGVADVVEFHRDVKGSDIGSDKVAGRNKAASVQLPGLSGCWRPFIVEYKHGAPKPDQTDEVQLCAQAMCLEEMLGAIIPSSSFFYGKPRRRHVVNLTDDLRSETKALAKRVHEMIRTGITPAAVYNQQCRRCSLYDVCVPKTTHSAGKVESYLRSAIAGGGEN